MDKKPTFLEWQREQRNKFRKPAKPAEVYYPGKIIPYDSQQDMQRAIAQQQAFMNSQQAARTGLYSNPIPNILSGFLPNG